MSLKKQLINFSGNRASRGSSATVDTNLSLKPFTSLFVQNINVIQFRKCLMVDAALSTTLTIILQMTLLTKLLLLNIVRADSCYPATSIGHRRTVSPASKMTPVIQQTQVLCPKIFACVLSFFCPSGLHRKFSLR